MDFDFTEEQVMLRNLAREVLAQESPPRAVRQLMEDPTGYDAGLWGRLAEMGLLGVAIDEAHGGQGLGMVELALVLEEMGRAAYPGPYFATVVLAAGALAAAGNRGADLADIAGGKLVATLAVLEDGLSWEPGGVGLRARSQAGEYVLSGRKRFVPFAHAADLLLVAARTAEVDDARRKTDDGARSSSVGRRPSSAERGITVFALDRDAPGLSLEQHVGIDLTSKTSTVTLEDVRVGREAVVGRVDEGWDVVEAALRRAAVGAAAEMLGAAHRCLEMSVEYAKVREQFGQPIGTFQAVKHACAEMLMNVENAHAATYYAAWAVDAAAPDAALAASVAKSYVGEAAREVCGTAIQVHGGIGFTWDYDLHLYFKRAKHFEALYGDVEHHRELVLREVVAPRAVPVLA